ncbi:MAG: hypothetical protein L3K09_06800, partial [Thermoplasmata archaeon]|nr:hypothetical protein [Thermoplasmata archaeon]
MAGIAVVVVIAGGAAAFLASPSGPGHSTTQSGSSIPTVYRNLTIAYNVRSGMFDYSSLQLNVPLNTRVEFTITNFDTATAAVPMASDAQVAGTFGGPMT